MYRAIQQWPALYAYFDQVAENDHSSRVKRLNQHLKSPLTKLVMLLITTMATRATIENLG